MLPDQPLVDRCRSGDRTAFAQIVEKYQTLICSIAYGMTGSFSASEELAQETFVSARAVLSRTTIRHSRCRAA